MTPYAELAARTVNAAEVPRVLRSTPGGATVLERIARGGGATNWFAVHPADDLAKVVSKLSPGSVVSFYFDDRLSWHVYDQTVAAAILRIAHRDGDAVVGTRRSDGTSLEVEFIASESELSEYCHTLSSGAMVLFGPFPGRDSDGKRAITVVLPDADGVVRPHPH